MKICVGGKNNIAVDVCSHIINCYPNMELYIIPNKGDDGCDSFQRSLRKFANNHNISIVSLTDIYEWEDLVFLSVEFDRIVKPEKFVSKQLFNIHFSLLPKYKGCHTAAMPILDGEELGGVTLHLIERGIDTGDIIDQEKLLIAKDETCRSLYIKYLHLGYEVIKRNLDNILEKHYKAIPQEVTKSTYFSRGEIDYRNIQIDYNKTATQVDRQFRAFSFREFQLPKFLETPIAYVDFTQSKSVYKPGTLVNETDKVFQIATIDYDILLYKDIFSNILELVSLGKYEDLRNITDLNKYIHEQEPIHGWTLLMVAAYHCQYDIAKYLVKLGSDVNATNYNGTTVIMYAKDGMIRNNDDRLFKFLLSSGANPFVADYSGRNLFTYIDEQLKLKILNM